MHPKIELIKDRLTAFYEAVLALIHNLLTFLAVKTKQEERYERFVDWLRYDRKNRQMLIIGICFLFAFTFLSLYSCGGTADLKGLNIPKP